jgi:hypothetical protein
VRAAALLCLAVGALSLAGSAAAIDSIGDRRPAKAVQAAAPARTPFLRRTPGFGRGPGSQASSHGPGQTVPGWSSRVGQGKAAPSAAPSTTSAPGGGPEPAGLRNRTAGAHSGKAAGLGFGRGPAARAALPGKSAGPHSSPTSFNRIGTMARPGQRPSRPIVADFASRQIEHRQAIAALRNRLPARPLPGERGFTGVPPAGESRFVTDEMVFHVGPNVSREAAESALRRLGLTTVGAQRSSLIGGTMLRLRIGDGRPVADVVRALEAENIGIAQPDYVFTLQQDSSLAARTVGGDGGQYVVKKLHLGEIHRVATGSNVLVAVIDSAIDAGHPDLAGAVVDELDAVGRPDRPHLHGTGMAGAIAARHRLLGIAPAARILAVHAFSPGARETAQATTRHIIAGLEWAIGKGARVINMSFAGPYDPMLALAMKNAREKGVVLVAAAGNMGPDSPPLYPAADPNVIAVTATDESDRIFAKANQGPHIAVAAPGVNIIEPAPNAGYQVTTGTSVAAAHVSGVAALMLERDPSLDPAALHEILTISAWKLGSQGHDDRYGWGLVDPGRALQYLDVRIADRKPAPAPTAAAPGALSSR